MKKIFNPVLSVVGITTLFGFLFLSPSQSFADTVSGSCQEVGGSCKCVCDEGVVVEDSCANLGGPAAGRCGGSCSCEVTPNCYEDCLAECDPGDAPCRSACGSLPTCQEVESQQIQDCQDRCLAEGNSTIECERTCSSNPSAFESGDGEGLIEVGNGTVTINPPKGASEIETPLGTIPTDPAGFGEWLLRIGIGLGTLLAVIFLIMGGFGVVTSSGDPEKLQNAKQTITAAVSGLVFLLISTLILHIIGIRIIGISPDILPF